MRKMPFKSWKPEVYEAGYLMGIRHAGIGDPKDYSDTRCEPLETERDNAASAYPFGPDSGAFYSGYEDGYQSVLSK